MGVVLLGYRGSGKTTVGQLLAARLGLPFVDLDAAIVAKAGLSIREIFETYDEAGFRDRESAALEWSFGTTADGGPTEHRVIATGGGVILRPENRRMLCQSPHARVYLRCDAATLQARIHADPATTANRPALTALGGGLAEIEALLAVREPLYRAVATATLDVTSLSAEEVACRIEETIEPRMNAGARG